MGRGREREREMEGEEEGEGERTIDPYHHTCSNSIKRCRFI